MLKSGRSRRVSALSACGGFVVECDADGHISLLCFAFAQSDVSERRLGKHALRNQPPARAAVGARQIVPDDSKVVDGDVRELRAAGALPDRPDVGRGRLQPLIDADIAVRIQFHAGLF